MLVLLAALLVISVLLMSPRNASIWVFLLVMLVPIAAFAQASADPVGTVRSVDDLVSLVVTVTVGAVVGWIGKKLGGWLEQSKQGKKAAKAIDDFKLEQMVADAAIHYAEEQVHKAIKAGRDRLSANEKLRAALDYAQAHGFADAAMDRVAKIIEARLGARRTGG